MEKYTFIADYRGGTYISQYCAENIDEALLLWADNLSPRKIFTPAHRFRIKRDFLNPDNKLIPIKGVENVWFELYFLGRYSLYLNVVKTV